MLNKYFPISGFTRPRNVTSLVVSIVIYVVLGAIGVVVFGSLLGPIPVVGIIAGIIKWIINTYCTVGIIIAILIYFEWIKK